MHDPVPAPPAPAVRSRWHLTLRRLLPFVVLAAGIGIATLFLETSPKARSKPPGHSATLVEVAPIEFTSRPATISAMGTVMASRSIDLHPQVTGVIVDVAEDFVPGGVFEEGGTLLRIDQTDYELAARQVSRAVAQAETDLRMEEGKQTIAKKDFELLGEVVAEKDRDMVLRKPQIDMARAALEAARAEEEKAKIDLIRTTVKAPFNAVVQTRQVNAGSRVTEQTSLATLIGTDTYWVEVAVPVNQLRWLQMPDRKTGEPGSAARIFNDAAWGAKASRTGRVVRMAAGLEEQGRMARIFVAVEDPMALKPENAGKPAMLIGSYVRAEIEGVTLESVAVLPRALLREGDTVWIFGADEKLEIRPVEVAFRGLTEVLVGSGLKPDERAVASDLSAPVKGMPLRTDSGVAKKVAHLAPGE